MVVIKGCDNELSNTLAYVIVVNIYQTGARNDKKYRMTKTNLNCTKSVRRILITAVISSGEKNIYIKIKNMLLLLSK